jgi:uncharacterized protein (TIGR02246 family)
MTPMRLSCLLLVLLFAFPALVTANEATAEHAQAAFFAALAERDAGSTAALFAEDAELHVAGMPPVTGRDAIGVFYARLFGFLDASAATPGPVHVATAGDVAWGTGAVRNTFTGAQGTQAFDGKYTLVWRRIDGDWRIAVYSISSNQREGG